MCNAGRFLKALLVGGMLLGAVWPCRALAGPADDQYAVAAGYYSRSNWKEAAVELSKFLEQYPQHERASVARFFYGEALMQLGRPDEAAQSFAAFLEKDPKHTYAKQALFRLGEAQYLSGKLDEARPLLEKFRQSYADDPLLAYVLTYLGEVGLSGGEADKAAALFKESLEKYPKGNLASQARLGLVRSLELKGSVAEAAQQYEALSKDASSQVADEAQLQLATLYYRQKQYPQAEKLLSAFDTRFAESPLRTKARYWMAMSQLAQKNFEGAAATLTRTIKAAPGDALEPTLEYYLGEAYRQGGKDAEATAHYDLVLSKFASSSWAADAVVGKMHLAHAAGKGDQVDALAAMLEQKYPQSEARPKARRLLGRSLVKREKFPQAAAVLEELVQSPPGSEDSANWYFLSLACIGQGRYADAQKALAHVKPAEGQTELAASTLIARAAAASGGKQYAQAEEFLRAYLKTWPQGADAPRVRADLTVALARQKQFPQARTALDDLTKAHPQHSLIAQTQIDLAEAAVASDETALARELFTVVAQPGHPKELIARALSGLAWCQYKGGAAAESAGTFEQLMKEHPDSPLAPQAALLRGKALEKAEQLEAALVAYQSVLTKYEKSDQAPDAAVGAMRALTGLKRGGEAAQLADKLVTSRPNLPNLDAVLYEWSWALFSENQAAEGEARLKRINLEFKSSPLWADATYRLAERAAKAKNYDQAIALADEIVQVGTAGDVLASALYLQGQVAIQRGRWQQATPVLDRAAAEYPKHALHFPAAYWAAESLYRQNQFDIAGERFAKLNQEIADKKESWLGMVPLRLAQVRVQQKKWSEALALASGITERFPDFKQQYEVDYVLGRCLANDAKFDEARAAYARVVASPLGEKTETAALAQWMIGETYFHQKRYDEAIKAYDRVEMLYDFPEWQAAALLQAGKCFEMKAAPATAARYYQDLLKRFAATRYAAEAKERLRVTQGS